jgi:hypothetical protein
VHLVEPGVVVALVDLDFGDPAAQAALLGGGREERPVQVLEAALAKDRRLGYRHDVRTVSDERQPLTIGLVGDRAQR